MPAPDEKPVDVILWVAWMARWGEPAPTHAYSAGIFDDIEAAREAGLKESRHRGGKYEFQHSPCHVDMLDLEPNLDVLDPPTPERVYLCSVTHPGIGRYDGRHHLVGLFRDPRRAKEVAQILYPSWKVEMSLEDVTKVPRENLTYEESVARVREKLENG